MMSNRKHYYYALMFDFSGCLIACFEFNVLLFFHLSFSLFITSIYISHYLHLFISALATTTTSTTIPTARHHLTRFATRPRPPTAPRSHAPTT